MLEFKKTDAAIPFVAEDTDKWTQRRFGDYVHRLAYEKMLPALGELNYPYTGGPSGTASWLQRQIVLHRSLRLSGFRDSCFAVR